MQCVHFTIYAYYFFLPWKILEEICSQSIALQKLIAGHIKHMYMQPFTMEVDWPEIGLIIMEVSIMIFTLYGNIAALQQSESKATGSIKLVENNWYER